MPFLFSKDRNYVYKKQKLNNFFPYRKFIQKDVFQECTAMKIYFTQVTESAITEIIIQDHLVIQSWARSL